MSRQPQLTSWNAELSTGFPGLSAPVVLVLAIYSTGMILAGASGLTRVVLFLVRHLGWQRFAIRKRLREFYVDADDKSGVRQGIRRRDFDVTDTFAPLLGWIIRLWKGKHLPLAIDVTNLGDRFHVLCVSVVVRGTAIPVAWKVLAAGVKDPWNPHWERLLALLKAAVPEDWTVVVLSDRGLESATLFRVIVRLGWHPLMRVKKGGTFRPAGWGEFRSLTKLLPDIGGTFRAEGRAYATEKLPCTLLARWDEGYAEPWFVLTDLPPEAAEAVWYGLRTWIEQGFKVIKGGGWDWDKTRMEDPERVERLWLVMAVATLWVTALGIEDEVREENEADHRETERRFRESAREAGAREAAEKARREAQEAGWRARREHREKQQSARRRASTAEQEQKKEAKKKAKAAQRHPTTGATAKRRTSRVSTSGRALLTALWSRGENALPRHLHPEPWPAIGPPGINLTEEEFLARQK